MKNRSSDLPCKAGFSTPAGDEGCCFRVREEVVRTVASDKTIKELATELTIAWVESWKGTYPTPEKVCEAYEKFYNKIITEERAKSQSG